MIGPVKDPHGDVVKPCGGIEVALVHLDGLNLISRADADPQLADLTKT